jgi:GntR family transcriptional regulator
MVARYRKIADELRQRIRAGEFATGESLPPQQELADSYHTTRAVISDAVRMLEGEGLLRAVRKRGTIVQYPVTRRRIERGTNITRDAGYAAEGVPGRTRGGYNFPAAQAESWVTHGTPRVLAESCPPRVAELLGVTEGEPVVRRRRVTSPKGEPPFQLADSWIHPTGVADAPRAAEPDTGPGGYLDRLEEAGHGPITWTEQLRGRMPTPAEADLLEIAVRAVVLEVCRVGVSARTNAPIEVTMCVIPADRVEIITPLQRDASARWPTSR